MLSVSIRKVAINLKFLHKKVKTLKFKIFKFLGLAYLEATNINFLPYPNLSRQQTGFLLSRRRLQCFG